ncbi:PR-1-like protein [Dichomitus squalens LYAD-421 SS1]|uniref:PR-1-like protein n=1 Tax=Dichomitus squalens (strain LYAD-421) TaxID=732165 RepID=R7T2J3_DICSQ|nr:PR-1-like protein [Dichomitus squalens LYAD-421 SS1]EJF62380.1 PR-1-like protein [Dichomitus squalens LYAD-421 SS1]
MISSTDTLTASSDAPTTAAQQSTLTSSAASITVSSDVPSATSSSVTPTTSSSVPPTTSSNVPPTTQPKPSSSTSSAAASQPTSPQVDQQTYLDLHNNLRSQVGMPDLQWSDDLAAKAQSYAEQCQLKHSDGALGPVGENLAAATGSFDALQAVELFVQDQFAFNPIQLNLNHYTQVIWRSTTQLGCGMATCGNIFPGDGDATYHVCLYDPVGNIVGEETLVHTVFVC